MSYSLYVKNILDILSLLYIYYLYYIYYLCDIFYDKYIYIYTYLYMGFLMFPPKLPDWPVKIWGQNPQLKLLGRSPVIHTAEETDGKMVGNLGKMTRKNIGEMAIYLYIYITYIYVYICVYIYMCIYKVTQPIAMTTMCADESKVSLMIMTRKFRM